MSLRSKFVLIRLLDWWLTYISALLFLESPVSLAFLCTEGGHFSLKLALNELEVELTIANPHLHVLKGFHVERLEWLVLGHEHLIEGSFAIGWIFYHDLWYISDIQFVWLLRFFLSFLWISNGELGNNSLVLVNFEGILAQVDERTGESWASYFYEKSVWSNLLHRLFLNYTILLLTAIRTQLTGLDIWRYLKRLDWIRLLLKPQFQVFDGAIDGAFTACNLAAGAAQTIHLLVWSFFLLAGAWDRSALFIFLVILFDVWWIGL